MKAARYRPGAENRGIRAGSRCGSAATFFTRERDGRIGRWKRMCGGGGPIFLELEEVPWKKYRCRGCSRTFRSMGRNPRCPDCASLDLTEI